MDFRGLAAILVVTVTADVTVANEINERQFMFAGGSATSFVKGDASFSIGWPTLKPTEIAHFNVGKVLFEREFSETGFLRSETFNARTCKACHRARGQTLPTEIFSLSEVGFTAADASINPPSPLPRLKNGVLDPGRDFHAERGPHGLSITLGDGKREGPNIFVARAIPLFGMGLLELIPDDVILSQADPKDSNSDGIFGVAVITTSNFKNRVGRYGWRASHANLYEQVRVAMQNELGLEQSSSVNGPARVADRLTDYVRWIAVPARTISTELAAGQQLFKLIGCADCHHPTYDIKNRGRDERISPFSDLLLHDIGTGSGDVRLIKTASLWGLSVYLNSSHFNGLLHDGRAWTIEDAISMHSGEASTARDKFSSLTTDLREVLLNFVSSL